jgi:hypothetical protein
MKPNERENEGNENFVSNGLTVEKLRQYKGYENLSEKELAEHLHAIKTIARVLFEFHKRNFKRETE